MFRESPVTRISVVRMLCIAAWLCLPIADTTASAEDGFHSIFDGKTLDGWDGNPKFWRVEDGAITGQTTEENPTNGNTFIIWRNGETTDFELKLEYKIVGGNSGIQYRSFEVPDKKWVVGGYQGDFEAGTTYSGILYGERFRGILALRGQKTVIGADHKPKVISQFADGKMLQDKIKKEDWNEYHIIARGFSLTHKINGTVMSECRDDDKEKRRANGILALQLHAGPPMKVQFRNIRIKHTSPAATTAAVIGQPRFDVASTSDQGESQVNVTVDQGDVKVNTGNAGVTVDAGKDGVKVETGNAGVKVEVGSGGVKVRVGNGKLDIRIGGNAIGGLFGRAAEKKKIAFVAGHKSHGYGAHEHRAGCLLLAAAINQNVPNTEAIVYVDGWPEEPGLLDDADAIVVYANGGAKHPFNSRLEEVDRLMKRGIGLVCLHYAVEVPKGESGQAMQEWIGGYFERYWSVNPHWTADYKKLPEHEITRGVTPFILNDEWYYHMRFRPSTGDITPILTTVPPAESLNRPDGPTGGNEFVRAKVGQPHHMAWAVARKDGGRGFGFTGGHVHWNWGHDSFRKLVLNAIVWAAHGDVPKGGVASATPTLEDLEANQDFDPPTEFNRVRMQALLEDWGRAADSP